MNHRVVSLGVCIAAVSLAGCFAIGNPQVPIGTVSVSAPRPSAESMLVIILPGFGNDATHTARPVQWCDACRAALLSAYARYRS